MVRHSQTDHLRPEAAEASLRGHVIFEWGLSPARLAIWTLRVIKVGRHECPGLHNVLSEHLGDDTKQAIQATQVLSFVIQKGRQLAESAEAFNSSFEPEEKLVIEALVAISKHQMPGAWAAAEKLAGAHSAIAIGALTDLAAIYERRGMTIEVESDSALVQ